MEHYVYLRERRRGARLIKTPYQAIKFWVLASGAVREAVPIFKGKGLTAVAGKRFQGHRTVEHSKTLIGPDGENNNQAEELNWRYDRAEKGIYLNIEPKYMLDYAAEIAFRSDTRRLPNGQQLRLAMNVALNVGGSVFWRGFTRGRHRTVELVPPLPLPSKASGPPKGRHPVAAGNGRVPRQGCQGG